MTSRVGLISDIDSGKFGGGSGMQHYNAGVKEIRGLGQLHRVVNTTAEHGT